jgi:hypothetical protein
LNTLAQTVSERRATSAAPHTRTERSKWPLIAFEFAVVLTLTLLCLEPLLTLAGAADDQIQDVDAVTGWSPMVNRSFAWRKEWYCRSRFNSLGLRGPERTISKPADTLRVAILGCSLTEALQVPHDKTFASDLEKQLDKTLSAPRKIEVINFGVSGYNLGQEYLRLHDFASKFSPDLVIVAARPQLIDNQLAGVEMIGPPPEFTVGSDGQLVLDRHRRDQWLNSPAGKFAVAASWLRYNSRLWGVIGICAEQLVVPMEQFRGCVQQFQNMYARMQKTGSKPSGNKTLPQRLKSGPDLDYGGKVVEALLKQIDTECRQKNCRVLVVYLPDLRHKASPHESVILKNSTSKLSIPYLDLNPVFSRLERQPHEPFLYVAHFTEEGHRAIADQLALFIKQHKLLQLH